MTDFWHRIPRRLVVRLGYLAVGIKIGLLWWASRDGSPWEHAVKLLALIAVVMAVAAGVRTLRERRGKQVRHHPVGRFLAVKVALVVLAVGAGLVLDPWVAASDAWVAIGLAVVVAAVGPVIHPWLVHGRRPVVHARPDEGTVLARTGR